MQVERLQAESVLVAQYDIRVGEPRRREGPRGEVELHAHAPSEETSQLREISPIRLVQDDSHPSVGPAECVEQEPEDLGGHGEGTHAQDLSAAREDDLAELASDRLRAFVDPEVGLGFPSL